MKINSFTHPEKGPPGERSQVSTGEKPLPAAKNIPLMPGGLLQGRIVRVEENGRVLVAVNQELVAARTSLALVEGSQHWFEVRRGGCEPWLELAARKGAVQELIRLLAGEEGIRGKAMRMLLGRAEVQQTSWPAAASLLFQHLGGQLAGGALGSQADPAGVILSMLLLQAPAGQPTGSFRRLLAEFLSIMPEKSPGRKEMESVARMLGLCDEVNRQQQAGERYYLFPCMLAGSSGWGEWMFSMETAGEEIASPALKCHLSFFLRLSRLGELHLQLDWQGATMRGRIHASDEEIRKHLEGYLSELHGGLHRLGFQPVQLSCHLAEGNLLRQLQEELRQRAGLMPLALVDIQA